MSSRNKFIKKNFAETSAADGVASINVENLQLTAGNMAIGGIEIRRQTNPATNNVNLVDAQSADVARVVYISFAKNDNEQLQLLDSVVVSEPGADRTFPGMITISDNECVVYAYGIKDKDNDATAKYANYKVESASDVARLVANRSASSVALALTATTGGTILAGENQGGTAVPYRLLSAASVDDDGFKGVPNPNVQFNGFAELVGGKVFAMRVTWTGDVPAGKRVRMACFIGNETLRYFYADTTITEKNGSAYLYSVLDADQVNDAKQHGIYVVGTLENA